MAGGSDSEGGMSVWKAIKWLAWTMSLGAPALGATAKEILFPSQGNQLGQRLIDLVVRHWKISLPAVLVWFLACILLWMWADIHDRFEKLGRKYPVFAKSAKLSPEDLNLRPFHEYFQETDISKEASAILAEKGGLLILGRPSGGKTRLAFELARKSRKSYVFVLRTTEGLSDWSSVDIPPLRLALSAKSLVDYR